MDINELIAQKTGQLIEKQTKHKDLIAETASLQEVKELNFMKKRLLQKASMKAREISYEVFSSISTKGIQNIFGTNVSVQINPGKNESKPTAEFEVLTNSNGYKVITDPSEEDGGGLADIVSLAAFFAMNVLSGDSNSAPLFLDEPTKFVSDELHSDAATFIKGMSDAYNKQTIMVTHASKTKYIADSVFEIKLSDEGASIVTKQI